MPLQSEPITVEAFLKEITDPDGAIDLSGLKKLGAGGTHVIYRSEKYPELLLKVMYGTVDQDAALLQQNLKKLDDQCRVLYETFEESRCIIEKRSIQPIKENSSDKPHIAVVSVVSFDMCFESKEQYGFNVRSAEMDGNLIAQRRYLYQMVNKAFIGHEKPNPYVTRNYPLLNKNFEKIFALLDTDESFRKAMREFLEKYKLFYEKTGILLDTIGLDNVLFYKVEGVWQFKLGSVIKHDNGALTKQMLDEINREPAKAAQSFEAFTSIYFMPACIRALNACAEKVGLTRVVEDIKIDEKTIDALAVAHVYMLTRERIYNHLEYNKFEEALELYRQYNLSNSSEDEGTRLRDTMGTCYWDYLKKGGQEYSRDEVAAYLEVLRDPRNQFPDFRQQEIAEAIHGLEKMLLSIDQKIIPSAQKTAPAPVFDEPPTKKDDESDKQFVARLQTQRAQLKR